MTRSTILIIAICCIILASLMLAIVWKDTDEIQRIIDMYKCRNCGKIKKRNCKICNNCGIETATTRKYNLNYRFSEKLCYKSNFSINGIITLLIMKIIIETIVVIMLIVIAISI